MNRWLTRLHGRHVHSRRIRVLARHAAALVPNGSTVLDVGCGDGELGHALSQLRPDLRISGLDVLVRPQTAIPVRPFDGLSIPAGDRSVDVVLLMDVLHHCTDAMGLMHDCARVARHSIIIKDHLSAGALDHLQLRLMDYVGNAGHGVSLPYDYWSEARWAKTFAALDWQVDHWQQTLHLYPPPADWLFGRKLHFLARCLPPQAPDVVG